MNPNFDASLLDALNAIKAVPDVEIVKAGMVFLTAFVPGNDTLH